MNDLTADEPTTPERTPEDWAQFIKVKVGPWLTPPPALPEDGR